MLAFQISIASKINISVTYNASHYHCTVTNRMWFHFIISLTLFSKNGCPFRSCYYYITYPTALYLSTREKKEKLHRHREPLGHVTKTIDHQMCALIQHKLPKTASVTCPFCRRWFLRVPPEGYIALRSSPHAFFPVCVCVCMITRRQNRVRQTSGQWNNTPNDHRCKRIWSESHQQLQSPRVCSVAHVNFDRLDRRKIASWIMWTPVRFRECGVSACTHFCTFASQHHTKPHTYLQNRGKQSRRWWLQGTLPSHFLPYTRLPSVCVFRTSPVKNSNEPNFRPSTEGAGRRQIIKNMSKKSCLSSFGLPFRSYFCWETAKSFLLARVSLTSRQVQH